MKSEPNPHTPVAVKLPASEWVKLIGVVAGIGFANGAMMVRLQMDTKAAQQTADAAIKNAEMASARIEALAASVNSSLINIARDLGKITGQRAIP